MAAALLISGCISPAAIYKDGLPVASVDHGLPAGARRLALDACVVADIDEPLSWSQRECMNAARAMLDPVFARVHKKLEPGCHVKVVIDMNNWTRIDLYAAASGEPLFTASPGINTHPDYIAAAIYDQLQPSGPYYEKLRAHPLAAAPAAVAAAAPPSSDVDSPSYHAAERPDDLAVVVGIEHYSDLPQASFAERDAQAFAAHARALGVPQRNIVLLTGQKAGRAAFEKYIDEWLPRLVKVQSRVYFYFSGHGAPDVKTGQAYLIPWDGDANFLNSTAYPLRRLYEKLGALSAKEVLVVLDSCFSGAGGRSVLATGARPLVTKVDIGAVSGRVTVLAASAPDEIAGALDEQGHGAFTYFLLKGLNGAAKEFSVGGLQSYVTPRLQDEARRLNRDQTPQLLGWPGLVLR